MQGTDLKEMELGYLYYSLYSYRRKIEGDIKRIIRAGSQTGVSRNRKADNNHNESLYNLTQKLRKVSLIISNLISLKKANK